MRETLLFLLSIIIFFISLSMLSEKPNNKKEIIQIDKNVYLQKLELENRDRIYLLVDSTGNIIGRSNSVNISYPKQGVKSFTLIQDVFK